MTSLSPPSVLILGANGRFGRAAVQAFAANGWSVLAQSRAGCNSLLPAGTKELVSDALDAPRISAACHGITVLVNALNPPYTAWEQQVPALTASTLAIARATGALLMLPGNVYNFGCRLPEVLTENTPQVADTAKAAIRIEQENRMREAAAHGVQSVVIRAGDFFGGSNPGTWLDLVIAQKLQHNRFTYPGPMTVPHAWAYLADLTQVFVAVAQQRARLPAFSTWHFAGATLTGDELCAALERVQGRTLRRAQLPWWLLRLAAPFAPMLRAIVEMRYLWQRAHRLDATQLAQLIGRVPHTPIEQALREALIDQRLLSAPELAGAR